MNDPPWHGLGQRLNAPVTTAAATDGHGLAAVRDWCKQAHDTGCLVGVGTHKPEVIAYVEEQGWDVDF